MYFSMQKNVGNTVDKKLSTDVWSKSPAIPLPNRMYAEMEGTVEHHNDDKMEGRRECKR